MATKLVDLTLEDESEELNYSPLEPSVPETPSVRSPRQEWTIYFTAPEEWIEDGTHVGEPYRKIRDAFGDDIGCLIRSQYAPYMNYYTKWPLFASVLRMFHVERCIMMFRVTSTSFRGGRMRFYGKLFCANRRAGHDKYCHEEERSYEFDLKGIGRPIDTARNLAATSY